MGGKVSFVSIATPPNDNKNDKRFVLTWQHAALMYL